MSRLDWRDEDDQPYYELLCDGCATAFVVFDDAGYDWRLLRDAATYCGWDSRSDNPYGRHYCPTCHTRGPRTTRPGPDPRQQSASVAAAPRSSSTGSTPTTRPRPAPTAPVPPISVVMRAQGSCGTTRPAMSHRRG
jgi:hypothetical protein